MLRMLSGRLLLGMGEAGCVRMLLINTLQIKKGNRKLYCSKFMIYIDIKLRMEMGNVPKRQQPDHRADNSRKATNGFSMQRETPPPGGIRQLAPKHICILVQ